MRGTCRVLSRFAPRMTAAAVLLLSGCTALTTDVLVNETGRPRPALSTHCAGSEWTDNSMIAVVPLPIISYASPTQEINEVKTDDVLSRCGPPDRLTNRRVEVDRSMCVPTVITRLLTLGIWHWCPANVSYEADVTVPASPAAAGGAPAAEPGSRASRTRSPQLGGDRDHRPLRLRPERRRSQMAAAFFNALADPAKARGISAGTHPAGHVHPEGRRCHARGRDRPEPREARPADGRAGG